MYTTYFTWIFIFVKNKIELKEFGYLCSCIVWSKIVHEENQHFEFSKFIALVLNAHIIFAT